MTHLKSFLWITVSGLVLALGVWVANKGSHAAGPAQETDKVLETQSYLNEPMELVKLFLVSLLMLRLHHYFRREKEEWYEWFLLLQLRENDEDKSKAEFNT